MTTQTIGLDQEHRSDFELRSIFVEAYDLVAPGLDADGRWISLAHEYMAHDAMAQRFPDISEVRLFAVLGSIASVHATGRRPVD
jgi:hypothetical protein